MKRREIGIHEVITKSAKDTKEMARVLAEEILKKPIAISHALVIGLVGELGSGKTTFAQGFAEGLGVGESVLSPTFVLMRQYPLKKKAFVTFFHIDCYRIDNPQEIVALGWHDLVADPTHLILIEWTDRIVDLLPPMYITLLFHHTNETTRTISIAETKKA